jgi:hypothetical protein
MKQGAGHTFNQGRLPAYEWPCEDPLELISTLSKGDDGIWWPARPVGGLDFEKRIRAAWLVLTGKAAAVRWK